MNLCLFDLDHTLLPLDSDHEFGEFLIRQGLADPIAYRQRNDGFYQQYCDGTLVLGEYIQFTTSVCNTTASANVAIEKNTPRSRSIPSGGNKLRCSQLASRRKPSPVS